jgi:hypothetical protein
MNLFLALLALSQVEKMDVGDKKALRVYSDGKKHLVTVTLPKEGGMPESAWYGDGKNFYRLRVRGGGADGSEGTWNLSLWEPRTPNANASLDYRDRKVKVGCGERNTELATLKAEDADKLLEGATFYTYRWTRQPYLLARDERGNYYFVDMLRDVDGKKDMKLYIGPRGKLKVQQMTNIVSDSMGDIFSTKSGELRLVANNDELKWVQGKDAQKLTRVPIDDNHVLIYTDLGVYERMPLGTPCDDL